MHTSLPAIQVVVKSSDTVNSIHMVVLSVEGIVLTLVVVIYVWAMAQKVWVFAGGDASIYYHLPLDMPLCP